MEISTTFIDGPLLVGAQDRQVREYIERKFIPGYRDIEGIHERLDALDKVGLIHHPKKGKWPGLKRYADGDTGNPPQNLVLEPTGFTNYSAGDGEYTGYATQKPLELYERIIKASSNSRRRGAGHIRGLRHHCSSRRAAEAEVIACDMAYSFLDDAQAAVSAKRLENRWNHQRQL